MGLFTPRKKEHSRNISQSEKEMLEEIGIHDVGKVKNLDRVLANAKKERKIREEEKKVREEEARMEELKMVDMEVKRREEKEEAEKRKGMVMERTEMSQTRMDITKPTMGLVDRMESHRAGTYMKNVVISNKAPPERELNLSRLRTYKAENDFSRISLSDIEPFDLIGDFTDLPITKAIPNDFLVHQKPYVLVSDIFIHYMPMDTFFSTAFVVDFFINDFRKLENVAVRHFPLTHTGGYNILFSLDYCVRTIDLKHITLSISSSISSFKKNIAWASVKTNISLTFMDFPIKTSMQETMGVLHLADSDLTDYISDPRHSDGVITPEAYRLLQQAHSRGDVEKINQNVDDRKDINPEKTSFGKTESSTDVADLMRSMRERALESERERSIHPPSKPVKPAMKKTQPERPFSPPPPSVVEENDEDIMPGDSASVGSEEGTIEFPRNPTSGSKKVVGWGAA